MAKVREKGFRFALMSCVSTSSEFPPRKPQMPQKLLFKRFGVVLFFFLIKTNLFSSKCDWSLF